MENSFGSDPGQSYNYLKYDAPKKSYGPVRPQISLLPDQKPYHTPPFEVHRPTGSLSQPSQPSQSPATGSQGQSPSANPYTKLKSIQSNDAWNRYKNVYSQDPFFLGTGRGQGAINEHYPDAMVRQGDFVPHDPYGVAPQRQNETDGILTRIAQSIPLAVGGLGEALTTGSMQESRRALSGLEQQWSQQQPFRYRPQESIANNIYRRLFGVQ